MKPDSENSNCSKKVSDLSDSELICEWKLGNELAAECIVERYSLRMITLVASRLNRRFRDQVDPEDIVQSAMGSFFQAANHSRIQFSQSASLWRLLATFAKRKMRRSIERQSAIKRGGDRESVSIDETILILQRNSDSGARELLDELVFELDTELPDDLRAVMEGALSGENQLEMASRLNVDARTIRRRLDRLYQALNPDSDEATSRGTQEFISESLPRVEYNQFVLGRLIGAGGFGKVYRAAMQTESEETVAVKFLRKAFWQDDNARQAFLREIDQAARVQHRSVVRYLGWGESPHGGPYVLMDWIDGKSLVQLPKIEPDTFVEYLRQVCDAIEQVHRERVVHGDLTPANIMVDQAGQIAITDFGFSRCSNFDTDVETDSPEVVLGGTLGFAAPEQIFESFGHVGPGTDIYAIGGLAYWYLTGKAPHDKGEFVASVFDTISAAEFDAGFLPSSSAAIESIREVAAEALRKSIRSRPSSVSSLTAILDRSKTP